MKISELLKPEYILPSIKATDKNEIIKELVYLLKDNSDIKSIDKVYAAVTEREKIMSTGVGKGFAIPHAKTDAISSIVAAFGRTDVPVEYNALDGEPVNLIFLLVGKENLVGPHIKLLSRISRMMNKDEFRKNLTNAKDTSDILRIISEEEEGYIES